MPDFPGGKRPIVIDCGAGTTKVGFAGDDRPRRVFPTVVGYLKHERTEFPADIRANVRDYYIGDEARQLSRILKLTNPFKQWHDRKIDQWDPVEKLLQDIFSRELCIDPIQHSVLLSEVPLNPRPAREKMAELLFEIFNVPAVYTSAQAVLALYATDRLTGLVLDIGDGGAYVSPIYEGFLLSHAVEYIDITGEGVTRYLQRLLRQRQRSDKLNHPEAFDLVQEIKEKLCYVALDPEKEFSSKEEIQKSYTLPDGEAITVDVERFLAPECLFTIDGARFRYELEEFIVNAIGSCDIDLRRDLYNNIVLSGGSTKFPGFKERLSKGIKAMIPENVEVNIIAHPERQYLAWIGGSVLVSLSQFQTLWVTREEYDEIGPAVIHRCF